MENKKSELQSESYKHDGIRVGRIRVFPFSTDSASFYDSVAYDLVKTRMSELKAEVEG